MKRYLVIGGGDLKFFTMLGMLIGLSEADPEWEPEGMVGTSAGAILVAGLADRMAMDLSFGEAIADLHRFAVNRIRKPRDLVRERTIWEKLAWPWKAFKKWEGEITLEPLAAILRTEADQAERWSGDAAVTLFDLLGRRTVYARPNPDTVLASASVPILTPPVLGYADGGVRDVVPLKRAIDGGADDLVVLVAQPRDDERPLGTPPSSLLEIGAAVLSGLTRETLENDLKLLDAVNTLVALGVRSDKRVITARIARAELDNGATIRQFTIQQRDEMLEHGRQIGRRELRPLKRGTA